MTTSVLDRFIFRFATATPAIPATATQKSGEKAVGVARIARIAVANAERDELSANDSGEVPPDWWGTFLARVDKCDDLINELCDLRGADMPRRIEMLGWRKSTSPANLDTDIEYLLAEIAAFTPAPPPAAQTRGKCVECLSFRRAGLGERCGHAARSDPGEPPLAYCLPAHACELFVHWRNP